MSDDTKPKATDADAAAMALAITMCEMIIDANLLSREAVAARLAVAQMSLQANQAVNAAGIVGLARAAILDPNAAAARKALLAQLTPPGAKEQH